jgi:hypothetical protein
MGLAASWHVLPAAGEAHVLAFKIVSRTSRLEAVNEYSIRTNSLVLLSFEIGSDVS